METVTKTRMTGLKRRLHRLWRQEDGTLIFEFLIFAPLMFWTFVATLAYFDLYRTEAISEKATMTIADMIGRERNNITDQYLDGTQKLLAFLNRNNVSPGMRVSVLRFHDRGSVVNPDTGKDHYHVVWSKVRGTADKPAMTEAEAKTLTDRLPRLIDGDRLILVETWIHYSSAYNLGLSTIYNYKQSINGQGQLTSNSSRGDVPQIKDITMTAFIFSQPRFQQTCFLNPGDDLSKRLC